ncbi:hypothetical protein AXF42_Ash016504 [Apostasia shenzhenica]|uniref:SOSEKI DIX-like domain-containing protein n=1 Tax=Apostasia shenzhenica TaxID=1088818 RepID=A0A2I0AVB0_9ASPA|nr:hypothetical protein AXF42_Ash016504 [Apostasia shenzhenica]
MEISHIPNQNLRLKDVIEKLTVLRGRGLPSLFSWSCKRSYKNGYVWNDLSENDVIYPADGAEYVLKGSEIIHSCIGPNSLERIQHLQLGNGRLRPLPGNTQPLEPEGENEMLEEEQEEDVGKEIVAEAAGHRSASDDTGRRSKAPNSRCSRGVSTDEIERHHPAAKHINARHTEIPLSDSSPPSSSSSDKAPAAASGCASFRLEDGDPIADPGLTRSSVLLQLISCGSVAAKARAAGESSSFSGFLKSSVALGGRNSGGSLRISGASVSVAAAEAEAELQCMSENPSKLGNPQLEEKEYFSGSIAEVGRAAPEPALKKSSSYKEERGSKLGTEEGEKEEGGVVRGRCIPGKKRSSAKQQEQGKQIQSRN